MARYATKTCNICGLQLPQPQMVRSKKKVQTGSSNTGITKRALFGAAMGEKKSVNQVNKFLWSPNKRTYTRTREVWMCPSCAGIKPKETKEEKEKPKKMSVQDKVTLFILKWCFYLVLIGLVLQLFQ